MSIKFVNLFKTTLFILVKLNILFGNDMFVHWFLGTFLNIDHDFIFDVTICL